MTPIQANVLMEYGWVRPHLTSKDFDKFVENLAAVYKDFSKLPVVRDIDVYGNEKPPYYYLSTTRPTAILKEGWADGKPGVCFRYKVELNVIQQKSASHHPAKSVIHEFDYHTGIGWNRVPTAGGILYCLYVDAASGRYTHKDFCAEFDYDTDSRKALELYLETQKVYETLRHVPFFKFDEWMDEDEIKKINIKLFR